MPFRNRNLVLLWAGQIVSQFGDFIFVIGLPLLAYKLTGGSKPQVGTVMFFYAIPFMALGIFAGVIVDRANRKAVMLVSDFSRICTVFTVPLLFWLGGLNVYTLTAAAFLTSCFATLFNPARDALIPDIVPAENLLGANSLMQTSFYIAAVAGALGATALIGTFGTAQAFAAGSATFAVSFATVALIGVPARGAAHREGRPATHPLTDLVEIAKYVKEEKRLLQLLAITAVDNLFIMGPATVGAMLFIKEALGKPDVYFALLEVVFALGIMLGILILQKAGRNLPKGKMVITGMFLDGATYIPFLWCRSFEALAIMMFIHAAVVSLIVVPRAALIQQHVPKGRLGRVFALVNVTVMGFMALSAAMTGFVAQFLTPPQLFFLAGLGGAICGLTAATFRSLRRTG